MTLIRTRYRAKLAKGFSYPIGSEALSQTLVDVPQFTVLSVSFHRRPLIFASEYRAALHDGQPLPIVTVSYANLSPGLTGSNKMVEEGFYDETWELTIFPVPSNKRQTVRALLNKDGLPAVRQWLSASRPPTWRSGRKSCSLLFDPVMLTLSISEEEDA